MTRVVKSLTARAAAMEATCAVLEGQGFLSERLATLCAALEPRDAALAREIAFGAVRHHFTLRGLLQRFAIYDERRTAPAVRALLHCAAYQLVWMTGVPVFAAVDESVALARRRLGPKAAGMVNAVLRRVSAAIAEREAPWRDGAADRIRIRWDRACVFRESIARRGEAGGATASGQAVGPAADANGDVEDLRTMALLVGERPERLRQLVSRLGRRAALHVAWASQTPPPSVLHRNARRLGISEFAARVAAELGAHAELHNGAAYVAPGARIAATPLLQEGAAYVQDTTAHEAAVLAAAREGEVVVDLCAAPGGKSITMAARGARVLACDVDERRLARLREAAARMGLDNIDTVLLRPESELMDAQSALADRGIHEVDAVFVDAPCSNTGVIARRPEARLGFSSGKLRSLVTLQRRLLAAAAELLRPAGRVVYSTCSIEREENEDIIAGFAQSHAGWTVESMRLTLPHWGAGVTEWRDGGFAALLRKP